MQGLKISKMQVIDNPKEDAQIPIVQNGTNYSMSFGTLYKLLIQISENSDILEQVSDAATEVACRLAAITDAENNISVAEEQREISMRNALEDIAEASDKADAATEAANTATAGATTAKQNADAAAEAANTAAANVKDGKSAYQIYYDTTTDNPKLTEAQWGNLMTGILNVLNSI